MKTFEEEEFKKLCGVVLGAKCLSRRDEAASQPSEDQFWPLPWGVGYNVGGCQEAVWFGCGSLLVLFIFPRINNFSLLLSFFIVLPAALFLFRNFARMELKVLPRRGEAVSRPSENQLWPLPWGVRCGKEEILGCDLQSTSSGNTW